MEKVNLFPLFEHDTFALRGSILADEKAKSVVTVIVTAVAAENAQQATSFPHTFKPALYVPMGVPSTDTVNIEDRYFVGSPAGKT